jgi:hypothetical protein
VDENSDSASGGFDPFRFLAVSAMGPKAHRAPFYVYYAPPVVYGAAPQVSYYYAPPAVSYYAPPAVSYYAPPSPTTPLRPQP